MCLNRDLLLLFSRSVMSNSFVTLWTIARQALLSMGFPRQEYWSGLPFPSPEDLLDSGIEPRSPALQADSLPFQPLGKLETWDMTVSHAPFSCNTYKYQKSSNLVVWERLIIKVE